MKIGRRIDFVCCNCRTSNTVAIDEKDAFYSGFNAAIDKAVEVVESANNFLDALNQDEVWNISCRQADRKLRAVIEELNKLKENI